MVSKETVWTHRPETTTGGSLPGTCPRDEGLGRGATCTCCLCSQAARHCTFTGPWRPQHTPRSACFPRAQVTSQGRDSLGSRVSLQAQGTGAAVRVPGVGGTGPVCPWACARGPWQGGVKPGVWGGGPWKNRGPAGRSSPQLSASWTLPCSQSRGTLLKLTGQNTLCSLLC